MRPAAVQPTSARSADGAAAAAASPAAAAAATAFKQLAARGLQQADGAAARVFTLLAAAVHSQLCMPPKPSRNANSAASLWSAIADAAAAAGEAAKPWLVAETAAVRCAVAAAAGDEAAQAAAAKQLVGGSGPVQLPVLWPPLPAAQPRGHGADRQLWIDPLASAVLVPPASAAVHGVPLPAELLSQLPLCQQAAMLELLLPKCSPAAAEAAVAMARLAYGAATDGRHVEAQQSLWRHPLLSWILPAAATALASSIPDAAPQLWHQVNIFAALIRSWVICE